MKSKGLLRTAALLAAIALAAPAFAKPISKSFRIGHNAMFGKAELKAGEYRLLVDGNKVTVQKGNDALAETQGRWEERAAKSNYNSVVVGDNGRVKELRFERDKRVLVLSE